MKCVISALMSVVWVVTIVGGCQSEIPLSHESTGATNLSRQDKVRILTEDGMEKHMILEANLSLTNVAAFRDTLESWGYSWREENSLVFIRDYHVSDMINVPAPATSVVTEKRNPDSITEDPAVSADTVVWQVFENAAFDSSIHTAVLTAYKDGQTKSVFWEIDVSSAELNLIRGAIIGPGGITMDEPVALGLWRDYSICVTGCCIGCAAACTLLGPASPGCWAGCCMLCYPTCVIAVIISILLGGS